MKPYIVALCAFCFVLNAHSQANIEDLLAAGIEDAKRFSTDYFNPATEGVAYAINNGWFNSAEHLKGFSVELSLIGNVSFIPDQKKSFLMVTSDYENIRFEDDSSTKQVATALGHNDPDITIIITYDDPIFGNQEVALTLPTGIGSENIDLIPTTFIQANVSLVKGTQIKGRYFPKIKSSDAEIGLYGFGIQQEFTTWLSDRSNWPVAISGLIAYTHLDGSYDFTESSTVEGENQRVETDVNTYLFELVASTKLNIINFYGGIGYISGKTTSDLLGTYRVTDGITFSEDIVDPFSIKQDISGIRATFGAHLGLGIFGLNADYTFAEFNSASLGINFSL